MPDRKFERSYDRNVVLLDAKQRIIDLMENNQELPDVGIYDEPLRYFKANQQWCKIIFGWLDWLEDVAGWRDAEDENHPGIQAILQFEEGINGTILMTPDEFKNALRDGLYEWSNNVAKQIVSGRYTNIIVDEDGTVSDPTTGGGDAGLPEDDPETPLDENSASRAGGAIAVTAGYNSIWADMNTWKTAGLSADVISFRLQQKYQMIDDASTDNFVALYFAAYTIGHINSYGEQLSGMLFCGGENFKNVVAEYIIDAITFDLQENAFALNNALSDEQITAWYNKGSTVPSSAYNTYPCVPIDTEIFQLDMSSSEEPTYNTSGLWKPGHRYLIEISGMFTDSDNPDIVQDGMYSNNTTTGIKTFSPTNFNFGFFIAQPTQAGVPFEDNHTYAFTIDTNPTMAAQGGQIRRNNAPFNLPNTTGILSYKVTDLGQYAL